MNIRIEIPDMKILITGSTGFKGSWLTLFLAELGHKVYGLALPPESNSLFNLADLQKLFVEHNFVDIRNSKKLADIFQRVQPDFLIHFAAQPHVIKSYANPRETYETNVMGTFNVLEATRKVENLKSSLIITTDKVYRNQEDKKAYRENDPLGGHDPYSSSKAMADIMTQSWAQSFSRSPILVARAGNVIGGGDFSKNRLIPDIFHSYISGKPLEVRNPDAVRPWQHVLDCLHGYTKLILASEELENASAWNFGPDLGSFNSVKDVLLKVNKSGWNIEWKTLIKQGPHENKFLILDSEKAKSRLDWKNKLNFEETIKWTVDWYGGLVNGESPLDITRKQVHSFLSI